MEEHEEEKHPDDEPAITRALRRHRYLRDEMNAYDENTSTRETCQELNADDLYFVLGTPR
jgi:hypothetical protein